MPLFASLTANVVHLLRQAVGARCPICRRRYNLKPDIQLIIPDSLPLLPVVNKALLEPDATSLRAAFALPDDDAPSFCPHTRGPTCNDSLRRGITLEGASIFFDSKCSHLKAMVPNGPCCTET